ncbi:hypothetical protein Tco_0718721, partial [Tanacetum coccineum]
PVSLSTACVTRGAFPYYPVDNKVITVWSTSLALGLVRTLPIAGSGSIARCLVLTPDPDDTIRHHVSPVYLLIMVVHTIDDVKSVLTQKDLDLFCAAYNIPVELGPEFPGPEDTIKDSPEGKRGIYTRLIEFANFPILKFMCHVLVHQPSLGTFRRFYVNSYSNGWFSFSKRTNVPCCTSKPLDSLKGWNDHFFWIDASICPIFVPWYNDVSVRRDPLPSNDISSYPSKVKTGERTLALNEVPLLTETANAVVNPSPQTIHFVTHTIADEIDLHTCKNKRKVGASFVPPPMKKARTGGVSIKEPAVTTAGKSSAIIRKLIKQANVDFGGAVSHAEEFVSFSVTPTPERDCEDEFVSNHKDNVRTCPPGRYVILSSSSTDTDNLNSPQVIPSAPFVQENIDVVDTEPPGATRDSSDPVMEVGGSSVPDNETGTSFATPSRGSPVDDFYDSQTIDSATAQNIYVPNWDVTNNARMDDPIMCRNLVNHVPPPGYWASLYNLNDEEFLDWVNLNSTQYVYMVFEFCLRYEHEIIVREKLEKKFVDRKAEDEAAGVVEVCKKVSELETTFAVRTEELASFSVQNAELSGQVEGEAKLKERFMAVQDDAIWCLTDCSCALDARLSELSCQVDFELYPHMLTAIAGRRCVISHGLRLAFMKCCGSVEYQTALGKVVTLAINQEAYDPGVQARYEEAVKEFENISLPFLARLKSYKDAPLERIMASLYLEGFPSPNDETPDFYKLQPVLKQALEASYARAQKHRHAASSSLAIVSQDQGISAPHVADVPPLNSIDVEDYTFLDGSMLKTTAEFESPNPSSVNDQSEAVHDYMFDTTLLDKPADP